VGVPREAVEEAPHLLADERVFPDLVGEAGEFALARQLAVDQEVRDLEERRLLGELVDRVTAVTEDALVAVDVRDRGRARSGVDEPRVERDLSGAGEKLPDVEAVGAFGGFADFQGKGFFPEVQRVAVPWLVDLGLGLRRSSFRHSWSSRSGCRTTGLIVRDQRCSCAGGRATPGYRIVIVVPIKTSVLGIPVHEATCVWYLRTASATTSSNGAAQALVG
jgi:hypothetical protein